MTMFDEDHTYLSLIISGRILKPPIDPGRMLSLYITQGAYLASDTMNLRLDSSAQCIMHLGHREPQVCGN